MDAGNMYRLGKCGVALAEGTRNDPIVAMIGSSPFFMLNNGSSELTEEELSFLEETVPAYITSHYAPSEIRNKWWGVGINSVILLKRGEKWYYRRALWTQGPPWVPENGLPLPELFESLRAH